MTGLERRLQARGGCCDCEAFLGGRTVHEDLQVPGEDGEAAWPAVRPPCAEVEPRSSRPCADQQPWRRGRW